MKKKIKDGSASVQRGPFMEDDLGRLRLPENLHRARKVPALPLHRRRQQSLSTADGNRPRLPQLNLLNILHFISLRLLRPKHRPNRRRLTPMILRNFRCRSFPFAAGESDEGRGGGGSGAAEGRFAGDEGGDLPDRATVGEVERERRRRRRRRRGGAARAGTEVGAVRAESREALFQAHGADSRTTAFGWVAWAFPDVVLLRVKRHCYCYCYCLDLCG
uniref:Uncharacterized protein n=1 Tax=Opuntia streptacantha TaxID=393608 RepID=A0A7C9D8Y7_OPUST